MLVCGHHLSSDLATLVRDGFSIPRLRYFDTHAAARWVWPEATSHSLEYLALKTTNMAQWRHQLGRLSSSEFDSLPDDLVAKRCAGDAEATFRLAKLLVPEIDRLGLTKVWRLVMDCLPVLSEMGGRGLTIDVPKLREKAAETEAWLAEAEKRLQGRLGVENVRSHQQLAEALFDRLGAAPLRKTTEGWSTDRASLLWARYQAGLKGQEELVELLNELLEFAVQQKLQTTHYRPWLGTRRVYSVYSLGGTMSGRLSSHDMNVQNIPDQARTLIVPSQGFDLICSADLQQIEFRMCAHISQDPVMLDMIKKEQDVHSLTAARALGLPEPRTPEEFQQFKERYPTERSIGKMTVFATIFGVGAESLSWQIFEKSEGKVWIPPKDAQKYIDAFFAQFKHYRQYMDEVRARLIRRERFRSPFGRCWQFPVTETGWRMALNYSVQSSASDITLLTMRALDRHLRRGWKTRMIAEVHDAIILETTEREADRLEDLLYEIFENPDTREFGFRLSVPIRVDVKFGDTWGAVST